MYVCIGMLFLWYDYFRGVAKSHISLILTVASLGIRVVLTYMLASNTAWGGWGDMDINTNKVDFC